MGPFARGNTFPGTLRCILRANLAANGVVGTKGAANSQGTLDIYVYSFRNHINVRVILFSYGLDANAKPLNQTINFGPKGLNGGWLWNVTGTWVPQSDTQMQLDSWFTQAKGKRPLGAYKSVYKMVKMIDRMPKMYYATVTTDAFPEGAIRGQFSRHFPKLLVNRRVC
ncbi:unnamed protein product [Closterium sp. NIES-64]|nr:unnamed protein product [Closterium sp. NIES-64]